MSELRRVKKSDAHETHWAVVGDMGAIHFHCANRRAGGYAFGGVEQHNREPFSYRQDAEPDHTMCWLLEGPCWHDGSSLYASEVYIPLLDTRGEDAVWARLEREYVERYREGNR